MVVDDELLGPLVLLLVEVGAPVGQVEDGEDEREDDARDDVDALGTQSVGAQPSATASLPVSVGGDSLLMAVVFVHEDDFRVGRYQRFLC